MRTEQVFVVSVRENDVLVSHMAKSECSTCEAGCEKRGTPYSVQNPRKLPVRPGQTVVVGASTKAQAVQGVVALLVPFLSAVLGFVLSPFIAKLFGAGATEGLKAVTVLVFLFASSLAVFLITRKIPLPGKIEIQSLCE